MSPTMSTVTSSSRRRNCATASRRRSTPFGRNNLTDEEDAPPDRLDGGCQGNDRRGTVL